MPSSLHMVMVVVELTLVLVVEDVIAVGSGLVEVVVPVKELLRTCAAGGRVARRALRLANVQLPGMHPLPGRLVALLSGATAYK
jgi:hypothetical protein